MEKFELNDNDEKLLAYCYNDKKHLSDIARHIGIDVKNVSTRIDKLQKMKLIDVSKYKNKKYVRTREGDKTKKYFLELLKQLKDYGGEMRKEDFFSLIPFKLNEKNLEDKFNAPLRLLFSNPRMVDTYIKINATGERFLKEALKQKK
jgi:DNA-binding MarR family transcriptional regulator